MAGSFNRLGQYARSPGNGHTVLQNSPFLPQWLPSLSLVLVAPSCSDGQAELAFVPVGSIPASSHPSQY